MTWTAHVKNLPAGSISLGASEAVASLSSEVPARCAAWDHLARRAGSLLIKGLAAGALLVPHAWAAADLGSEYRDLEAAQNAASHPPGPGCRRVRADYQLTSFSAVAEIL